MKKLIITSILTLLATVWSMVGAQNYLDEYLGLPGDNLNLYATMKLFQESETLESFEKSLNDENSRINNLDLNGDNQVDYIMVIDYVDRDVHSIVMRAALNRDETQDVGVFTVQRFNDGTVQIQLVGDEALYGKNYIVEPIFANNESETPNPGYTANNSNVAVVSTTTYEIAAWPVVRYIFLPNYVTWHSLCHWGYYPTYWNPWRPFYWHTYYGYHYNMHNHYYSHYRMWNHHRYHNYNNFYYSNIRTYSHNVRTRINKGHYKNTYSRPDLRKSGDVLYSRTNSRTRANASTDSRRINNTKSATSRSVESKRSGVERGSATNTSRRVPSSVNQGSESSRRSAAVTNTRTVKSSSVRQNSGNTQRSPANVSNRNVSRTPQATRSVSSRSSSGQGKTKSAVSSRSSGDQPRKAVSSRSSRSSSRSSGSVSSRKPGSSNRSSVARSSQSRTSSNGRSGRR